MFISMRGMWGPFFRKEDPSARLEISKNPKNITKTLTNAVNKFSQEENDVGALEGGHMSQKGLFIDLTVFLMTLCGCVGSSRGKGKGCNIDPADGFLFIFPHPTTTMFWDTITPPPWPM